MEQVTQADVKHVKTYLRKARELDTLVHTKLSEIDRLRELAECLSSPRMGEKVSSNKGNTSMQTVDKIVDLQAEIRKEIAELVSLIGEIHAKIELLENPIEKAVLTERYINMKSWEEIAEIISYSERNTKYIHGRALKNFALFCTFLH
jgi:DNA-directed RNA polymerase specialized sigma subunit